MLLCAINFSVAYMALHLDVEIITKQIHIPQQNFLGFIFLAIGYKAWYFASKTSGTSDYALVILFKHFVVDAWNAIEAFEITERTQSAQVSVTDFRLRQQNQMANRTIVVRGLQIFNYVRLGTRNKLE